MNEAPLPATQPPGGFGAPSPPQPPLAPREQDALGWTLVGIPAVSGVVGMLFPDVGSLLGFVAIGATVVLIGVDASRHRQRTARHVVPALLLWMVFYPVYMHRRAAWGAPNRVAFAIGAMVLYFVGAFFHPFTADDRALVRCKPIGTTLAEGYDCTIERTSGSHAVDVCWDLALVCPERTALAHGCGRAAAGESVHVNVSDASLNRLPCSKLNTVELRNITVALAE